MRSSRRYDDPRTSRIILRVTPTERAHLEAAALVRDTTLSEVVRQAALGLSIPTPPPPRVEREMVVALNRLGANLWRAMQHAEDLRPHIQPILADIAAIKGTLCD